MFQLLGIITKLIQKEPLILYPAAIASFVTTWLAKLWKIDLTNLQYSRELVSYLLAYWAINVLVNLITAEIGKRVLHDQEIVFSRTLQKTFLRALPVMLTLSVLMITIASLLLIMQTTKIVAILFSPLLFAFILAFQLLPVIYVISACSISQIYTVLLRFFVQKFRILLSIFLFMLFTFFLTALCFSLLEQAQANLRSVFIPLIQGLMNVVLIYAIIIFWFNQAGAKVNTKA